MTVNKSTDYLCSQNLQRWSGSALD